MNECPVCGEEFESGESLHEHILALHPGRARLDDLSPEEVVIAAMLGGDLEEL